MGFLYVILQIIGGLLLADFLSGLIHYWLDKHADPNSFAMKTNAMHHERPNDFLGLTFIDRNRVMITIGALFIVAVVWLDLISPFTLSLAFFGILSNEFHAMSHRSDNPKVIRALQRIGLICSRKQHAQHHRGYEVSFCIITSWLNPILERIKFWRCLDKITGIDRS